MTCNKNCNQGRNCDCYKGSNKEVVVAILYIMIIVSIGFLAYKLLNGNAGQDCAVEVQFKDSKAIYFGTSV